MVLIAVSGTAFETRSRMEESLVRHVPSCGDALSWSCTTFTRSTTSNTTKSKATSSKTTAAPAIEKKGRKCDVGSRLENVGRSPSSTDVERWVTRCETPPLKRTRCGASASLNTSGLTTALLVHLPCRTRPAICEHVWSAIDVTLFRATSHQLLNACRSLGNFGSCIAAPARSLPRIQHNLRMHAGNVCETGGVGIRSLHESALYVWQPATQHQIFR